MGEQLSICSAKSGFLLQVSCGKSAWRNGGLTERKALPMCILLYAWEETSSAACQYRCASVFWENQGALRGQCDRGGSCFCEPRDTCSLSPPCPPPSNFFIFFLLTELQMPSYLGEWWRREECGATTCFSLTQDLVTHLTVNLIPSLSILSPGRGGGGCVGGVGGQGGVA